MIRQPQQVSLFGKLATIIVGAALLVLGLMFSVVLIAVFAVFGVAVWLYLRWKTRGLRKAMREQASRSPEGGTVIDGEAVIIEDVVVEPPPRIPGPEGER
ncbi:MAG: hypothetical protein HZA62_10855 [Rhodocyclales bacterium]|nr:hypothetical protein [Rhodocyclales bacterium]